MQYRHVLPDYGHSGHRVVLAQGYHQAGMLTVYAVQSAHRVVQKIPIQRVQHGGVLRKRPVQSAGRGHAKVKLLIGRVVITPRLRDRSLSHVGIKPVELGSRNV